MVAAPPRKGFPLFLRLDGLAVLVVGGGPIALEKARALHAAGACLHVVAPAVDADLSVLASFVQMRAFVGNDLEGKWLVVSAATPEVNRQVREAADARHIFAIAVDDVANCSAIGAASVHRGGLTFAISSDGRAPALVALLRRALSELVVDDVISWVDLAERAREGWKAAGIPFQKRRPLLLEALNRLYEPAEGGA